MNNSSEEKKETSQEQEQVNVVSVPEMSLEEVAKREMQYRALVDFFKKDIEIKTTLMSLAPTPADGYSEESRICYLDKLFSELKDIELKFNTIAKSFDKKFDLESSFATYFERAQQEFTELGYSRHESLQSIYKTLFTDMKPELVEKTKSTFFGYKLLGCLRGIPSVAKEAGSINELLHIVHSSIINDEELLQSLPILGTKKNAFGCGITLYGKENEVAQEIFDKLPPDLDISYTSIISMENKTLMMIRSKGHALSIEIDSSDEDNVDVRYFIPKICNLGMVKALPGVNESSISDNGAVGHFVAEKEGVSENIFSFIAQAPTDKDIPRPDSYYDIFEGIIETEFLK